MEKTVGRIYVQYRNSPVRIGEDEDLNMVSFQKYQKALSNGLLSKMQGYENPERYIKHSTNYYFRFPFPDEDHLAFGDIGNFSRDRSIRIQTTPADDSRYAEQLSLLAGKDHILEILHQKLVYLTLPGKFSLVLIVRNPDSGHSFRIEDETVIPKLNRDIIHNHILKETDRKKKQFYRSVIARILQGYRHEIPIKQVNYLQRKQNKLSKVPKRSRQLV